MTIAIEEMFPDSHHRLCLWHIMKKLPAKLSGHAQYKLIKKQLKNIVYNSLTIDECDKNWMKMIEDFNLENNDWLKSLYEQRNRWIPVYVKDKFWAGLHSVAFSRLVVWFTKFFEFIKDQFALPSVMLPALGGLGAGMIALKDPGILYWGFTNVEEILHTGKSASAPGIWLLTQLVCAKVVATAICKGSGLVGGLYAPSLMIGAALGAVFGGSAAELINSTIPGNGAVAQPQAYALVGMAATLASVCSVPLTSVLLLFELTKDYRILLPLMVTNGFHLLFILF
ncbi:chloride channel protein CLC-f-like [Zingiber officinale]|uniref:chloride channel protein CLC-f-like n=1 Tax=Zingiber officinale TaxID=94328 RepID=UPI001C4BFF79|nr:chloride channel protein CLC-f-like [Zingiber officinale]